MEWVTDHILWLLAGAWLLSLALMARALLALWRWIRPQLGPPSRSWLKLLGTLIMLAASGLVLVVASSGLSSLGPGLLAQRRMLGEPAPELTYTRLVDGRPGRLSDHRGQVVLVNQWATWCPPCRQEMPDLDRLQRTYRDRGLVVVHVSDETPETVRGYLDDNPMTTEHGLANPLPWTQTGRPTTFVIDRDGVVRGVVIGSRTFDTFAALIEPYL